MLVTKEFTFDSAHFLTQYHGKCENLHGHTYKLHVTVKGNVKKDGMVTDFVILKKFVNDKIVTKLDHISLNDIFENPTAEIMAKWIFDEMKGYKDAEIYEIRLWETPTSFVTYNGE